MWTGFQVCNHTFHCTFYGSRSWTCCYVLFFLLYERYRSVRSIAEFATDYRAATQMSSRNLSSVLAYPNAGTHNLSPAQKVTMLLMDLPLATNCQDLLLFSLHSVNRTSLPLLTGGHLTCENISALLSSATHLPYIIPQCVCVLSTLHFHQYSFVICVIYMSKNSDSVNAAVL